MTAEKFVLPLGVFASVATVYLLFRNQNANTTQVVTPNPSSAGVTGPYSSQGIVAPVHYDVPSIPENSPATIVDLGATGQAPFQGGPTAQASAPGPSYIQVLLRPFSARPSHTSPDTQNVPAYLGYNFPPINAPFRGIPKTGGCGGGCSGCSSKDACGGCGQPNGYVDGPGRTKLSSSRVAQVTNGASNDFLERQAGNLISYLALDQPDSIPTLTSNPRSGRL